MRFIIDNNGVVIGYVPLPMVATPSDIRAADRQLVEKAKQVDTK